jgi:hypothetical protein
MNSRLLFLPLLLLLAACWVDVEFPDYDLGETPFSNAYLERSAALLQVEEATGFTCPDGTTALIYFVSPTEKASLLPSAVLFHGGNFDYVDPSGDHFEDEDRLSGHWAQDQIHNILGIGADGNAQDTGGAWVAALIEAGYRVALPGNCWGDLWHGKGQGDLDGEGFLRLGSYLATETHQRLLARPDASSERILAIGLAEGGRAITELELAGVSVHGAVLDASPDYLSPLVTGLAVDRPFTDGLLQIYDYDVRSSEDEDTRLDLLRSALNRDSLAHHINNLDYRTPIFYGYSSLDERIRLDSTLPARDAISNRYPTGSYEIVDWQVAETAPTNSDLERVRSTLDWFDSILPPLPTLPSE